MNYQICKSCGLGSLPTAQSCTRCGLSFSESANRSVNQSEPQKTLETLGQQLNYAVASPPRGNNNIYWIIGGIGGLVLVAGLFIVIGVIGFLLYYSKKDVSQTNNRSPYPINARPTPIDDKTNTTATGYKDEELAELFTIKKQVGKFTHTTTFPAADSPSKKTFQNSVGEAQAMYESKEENGSIIYSIASYGSSETAQAEFRNFIGREKQNGAKMISDLSLNSQGKTINASYRMGVLTVLTFCSWKMENTAMCHRIGSPERTAVIAFHNSWFNVK